MQRSQRKRCAPSWLQEKPYIKVRFVQDGVTTKVTESSNIKLAENGKELAGFLSNFTFQIGQVVWCYWKTANEKQKAYFEAKNVEVWDNAILVESDNSQRETDEGNPDEVVHDQGKLTLPESLFASCSLIKTYK